MLKSYLLAGFLLLPNVALASNHSDWWGGLSSKFTEVFTSLSSKMSIRVSCSSLGSSPINNFTVNIDDKNSTITVEKIDSDRLNFALPMQDDGSVWIDTSFTHKDFVEAAGQKYPEYVNRYRQAINKDISQFHEMEQKQILETVNNRPNSIRLDRETGKAVWVVGALIWPKYATFPAGFSDQKSYKMTFNCKPLETKF